MAAMSAAKLIGLLFLCSAFILIGGGVGFIVWNQQVGIAQAHSAPAAQAQ